MKKTRILVVDDEPSLTRQLKRQLEATQRFEVWTENSGQGALKAAGQFRPEVVLLDVMMPDMDGGEVKFRLEQMPELADTVFIYITALYNEDHNDKGIFLTKPVKLERIVQCIDQQLGANDPLNPLPGRFRISQRDLYYGKDGSGGERAVGSDARRDRQHAGPAQRTTEHQMKGIEL